MEWGILSATNPVALVPDLKTGWLVATLKSILPFVRLTREIERDMIPIVPHPKHSPFHFREERPRCEGRRTKNCRSRTRE